MGEGLEMVVGGPEHGHALFFGILCAILPVWLSYEAMVRVLKWLTLALLAYVAVVMMLQVNWARALHDTVIPQFSSTQDYWLMIVAVLGTTISPYLFFWQASQEAELRQQLNNQPIAQDPLFMREHLSRIRLDTVVGMLFSNGIAFCIMLATATTLHQNGITDIQTSRQAAEALRPIAGDFTFILFALGLIGTGMLAVPVLAGSAAYAVADIFQWRSGLNHRLTEARGFYAVLICATLVGTGIDFTALDPIKALLWSAITNGVVAVPIMVMMLWLGQRQEILGDYVLSWHHRTLGWLATLVMFFAVVAMVWSSLFSA